MKKLIWLHRIGGGGGVETIYTGTAPFVLTKNVGKTLLSLRQIGLVQQSSTPNPSSPVPLVCNNGTLTVVDTELPIGYRRVLDITFDGSAYYRTEEKLYGSDVVTMTLSNTASSGQNVFGAYSGTAAGNKNFSFYVYGGGSSSNCYLRYNEDLYRPNFGSGTRTITFGAGGTTGFNTNVSFNEDEFESTAKAYIGHLPNSSSSKYSGTIVGPITVGSRLKYIPCERISDNVVGYYEVNTGVFIEPYTGSPTFSGYDTSHLAVTVVGDPEVITVGVVTASACDLLSVSTSTDIHDIVTGKFTRAVGSIVLTGEEADWALSDSGTIHRFRGVKPTDSRTPSSRAAIASTHFVYASAGQTLGGAFIGASQYWYFIPSDQTIDTVEKWKEFLVAQYAAGTPVIVLYPLAEPIIDQVDPQAIPVEKGDVTVTTEANVSPITFTAVYKKQKE